MNLYSTIKLIIFAYVLVFKEYELKYIWGIQPESSDICNEGRLAENAAVRENLFVWLSEPANRLSGYQLEIRVFAEPAISTLHEGTECKITY